MQPSLLTHIFGEKAENFENPFQKKLTPPLKWAGGKRWLVPILQRLYEPHKHRRLVEPFVGGMAVALGILPEKALLSDINPHLINFYEWLKKGLVVEMKMLNDESFFYESRKRFNDLVLTGPEKRKEAAELFYYLNRTCFNGLCRFNSKGEFNVPFGKYKNINYVSDFSNYSKTFKNWTLQTASFDSLQNIQSSDFLYADPPYHVQFTKYSKEDFTMDNQKDLVSWLLKCDCPLVVSNQATDEMRSLYQTKNFDYIELPAPRRISCNGDRKPALEMLAARNLGNVKLSDMLSKIICEV